jgi:hypothetical protein
MAAALAVVTLLGGAALGYGARLYEFKRDQRRTAYIELVAAFLAVTRAGTVLFSTHVQLGQTMFEEARQERTRPMWADWRAATQQFPVALAAVRLIGSAVARDQAEAMETFIEDNVWSGPPFKLDESTDGWGEFAKEGPNAIGSEADRMAKAFTDAMRPEILRWRLPN